MTRAQRLRRAGLLCCHFIRNLAYYRAGWRAERPLFAGEFWTTANGNFLDACILEWCKLFGDSRGQHHWGKVVTDPPAFLGRLLDELGLDEAEFDAYRIEVRAYRDKFVAHLDSDLRMNIPDMTPARVSAFFLYRRLLGHEDGGGFFVRMPRSPSSYYASCMREARHAYE